MVEVNQIFDLEHILINELVGDVGLFILIVAAIILFVSIKYKIPMQATFMIFALFMFIIFVKYQMLLYIYVDLVLIIGFIFYLALSRYIRRG